MGPPWNDTQNDTLRKVCPRCRHCKIDRGPSYRRMSLRRVPFFFCNSCGQMKKNISPRGFVFFGLVGIYIFVAFFLGTQGVVFSGISRDPLSFVLMVHPRLMGRHCHTGCNNHAISTGPVLFYMQVSELGVFHIAQVLTFLHCFLEWSSTICSGSTYNPCGTIWDCPRITTSALLTYP